MDLSGALVGILLLSPFLLLILLYSYCRTKQNPFFIQRRPGLNGRIFNLIKLRTMSNEKDSEGNLLPDNERITGFGRLLRNASIDELPQLFNILKGDMSLVGPRPLLPEYLPLYSETQRKRHNVRPGITGWAQINGRNAISWQQKFEYDVWYVDHVCFSLDVKILFKTIEKVFSKQDINNSNEQTMPMFNGYN